MGSSRGLAHSSAVLVPIVGGFFLNQVVSMPDIYNTFLHAFVKVIIAKEYIQRLEIMLNFR